MKEETKVIISNLNCTSGLECFMEDGVEELRNLLDDLEDGWVESMAITADSKDQ
ncbi:hypothetical protein Tlie_1587 [Thermovirga lienii DSM 17291]|uniref:Uncharacterized protein n=1 Tax=Thermovirga lienii (strain ATCC BAA-1197 / DSM 17291 / Cas60314) TaxID=580340 RepID=G7V7Q5_THELD|nr:hypothetical protein [Thermovirga lienii]AER67309.1 hypothetical protein Tlie_1587 [Thermovirga lienii DSM 17291]